jgi:hypothetical protein
MIEEAVVMGEAKPKPKPPPPPPPDPPSGPKPIEGVGTSIAGFVGFLMVVSAIVLWRWLAGRGRGARQRGAESSA